MQPAKVVLEVRGMTCGGCVASVARALQRVPGVRHAAVTLDPPRAVVDFDPAETTALAMIQAAADAGYAAAIAAAR